MLFSMELNKSLLSTILHYSYSSIIRIGVFSDAVKESCSTHLVKAWLDTYSGDKLTLLGLLDVENSLDITQQLLCVLFKKSSPDELTTGLEILDDAYVSFANILVLTVMFVDHNVCKNSINLFV